MSDSHDAFIERWAEFVRTQPQHVWKKIQGEFINAQYDLHVKFVERMKKTPEGRKRLKTLWRKK